MDLIDFLLKDSRGKTVNKLVSDLTSGGGLNFKKVNTWYVPKEHSAVFTDVKFNPMTLLVDPEDPVISSHELGHLHDFTNNKLNKFLYSKLFDKPILHNLNTLIMERNANKQSWDIISKAYKDNPDALDLFKKLRTQALVPAYKTYLIGNGIPLAGAVGTGVLGAWLASRLQQNDDYDKYTDTLDPEERDKLKKRIKRINGTVGAVLGGGAGLVLGNTVGNAISKRMLPKAFDNFKKVVYSDSYLSGVKELASKIMKAKVNS